MFYQVLIGSCSINRFNLIIILLAQTISWPRPKAKHNINMPLPWAVTLLLAYKFWENCGGWLSHLGVFDGLCLMDLKQGFFDS